MDQNAQAQGDSEKKENQAKGGILTDIKRTFLFWLDIKKITPCFLGGF